MTTETTTRLNTLEMITLQNQLLLAIGGTRNSREVMHTFMQTAVKQIDLHSIHLYSYDDTQSPSGLHHDLALPLSSIQPHAQEPVKTMLNQFVASEIKTYGCVQIDDHFYTAYELVPFGVLIFDKQGEDLQKSLKDVLLQVMRKLAEYYCLCATQKQLSEEAKLNKQVQTSYELQAKRDPLTNLPNRREFRYSLFREISNSQRYEYFGALMYIDLDNFKNVNDSLGHSVGDILLTHVADRLSSQARSGDTVFRLGGDEFVYILCNTGKTEVEATNTAKRVALRVIEILSKPIDIGEFSLHITPSIGIAIFPESNGDSSDSEDVLKHADTAMYRAKKMGRNRFEFFNPEMHLEASKRLIIEDHLRKAITNNELQLGYQPIVDIDNNIIGAESLIRWNNPSLGIVDPDQFITIAEESNLILDLSRWITLHACQFAEVLYKQLPANSTFEYISINVSPRQFIQGDFVESMANMIRSCHLPEKFIKLEFTESLLLDDVESTIAKMQELIDTGIDFLLDDFGTGYSSLAYLHKLPIYLLKIDKSFITDFDTQHKDKQAIVNAILVMAEQLGIECIIEGVEQEEHAKYFREKNVHGMQGYYFYKPMPGTELLDLLSRK
jgi:diguanylate cyclase (GGDEF)-like protein